ncbi:MAG: hypothetical protein AB7Q97_01765 [Gammaproteobacteria bacterium]
MTAAARQSKTETTAAAIAEAVARHVEIEVSRQLCSLEHRIMAVEHAQQEMNAKLGLIGVNVHKTQEQVVDMRDENRKQHEDVSRRIDQMAQAIGEGLRTLGRSVEGT